MAIKLSFLFKGQKLMVATILALSLGQTAIALQDLPPPEQTKNPPTQEELSPPLEIDPTKFSTPRRTQDELPSAQSKVEGLDQFPDEPDQKVVVRERYAGWKQANAENRSENVTDNVRANWIMLSSSGLLSGTAYPSQDADVAKVPVYLLHRGQVISQTKTDAQGNFSFNNVEEATYSIVGFGDNAFFAFGFNAIEYRESTFEKMSHSIQVMAVQNKSTINLDWIRYFAPGVQYRVFGRFISNQGSDDPPWLYGLDGIATHGPAANNSTSIGYQATPLGPDGKLVGRIHQIDELNGRPVDVRSMRVMLLKDNDVAAAVSVDNFGVFEFVGISAGQYALVAFGADGMACIGIELVETSEPFNPNDPKSVLDLALVSPESVGWLNHTADKVAYDRIINRPMPPMNAPCNQCIGDLSSLYCNRDNPFRKFWDAINTFFDMAFYGETTGNNGANGGTGNGTGGCNQCGGAGCANCNGGLPVPAYEPIPIDCGGIGCGQPGCSSCGQGLRNGAEGIELMPPVPTNVEPTPVSQIQNSRNVPRR